MNSTLPGPSGTCGLLLAALAAPLAAQAVPLSTIQVNGVQISGVPLVTVNDSKVSFGGTAAAAEASRDQVFTMNGTEFSVTAYGYASPDALRASSTLAATSSGSNANHLHMVFASVTDGLRIDSALYDGQLARITYALNTSGTLATSVVADGFPIAGATARWRLSSGCAASGQCTAGTIGLSPGYEGSLQSPLPGFAFPAGDEPGALSFTIEAAFGLEIPISTVLEVNSQLTFGNGSAGAVASANADFTNTVVWGGIQSVTLLDGTVVTDWTTLSGSGFDYGRATVVPVPAAAWLFGSAMLGLGLVRRRHQSR